MAKFSILPFLSRKATVPNTVNYEGGRAFTQTAKLELVSVMLTTFLEDEFYRTEKQTTARIRELIAKVGDPRFVAQAALYARNTHGMRSVSHLVAGELAKSVKGAPWTKRSSLRSSAARMMSWRSLAIIWRPMAARCQTP